MTCQCFVLIKSSYKEFLPAEIMITESKLRIIYFYEPGSEKIAYEDIEDKAVSVTSYLPGETIYGIESYFRKSYYQKYETILKRSASVILIKIGEDIRILSFNEDLAFLKQLLSHMNHVHYLYDHNNFRCTTMSDWCAYEEKILENQRMEESKRLQELILYNKT